MQPPADKLPRTKPFEGSADISDLVAFSTIHLLESIESYWVIGRGKAIADVNHSSAKEANQNPSLAQHLIVGSSKKTTTKTQTQEWTRTSAWRFVDLQGTHIAVSHEDVMINLRDAWWSRTE